MVPLSPWARLRLRDLSRNSSTTNSAVRAPQVYLAFKWGSYGYIIMEYIDGQICGNSDVVLVAAAVQSLIAIPSPTSAPGPVGGGVIEHPFFIERTSSVWYESVEELEGHINGILFAMGRIDRVSLGRELFLCPSDLHCGNFMKDEGNRIVAIDFGGYSFLPHAFFDFVLNFRGHTGFAQRIANKFVDPPPSTQLAAMMIASCSLVSFSNNNIGLSKKLKARLE